MAKTKEDTGKNKAEMAVQKQAQVLAEAEKALGRPYDYDEQSVLAKRDYTEALAHRDAAVHKLIEFGKRMAIIREASGHGKFQQACELTGASSQRVEEAIKMFQTYGELPPPALLDTGKMKMLELMRLPEDELEEVAETGMLDGDPINRMSWRKTRETVRKLLSKNEHLQKENTDGKLKLAQALGENSVLKSGFPTLTDKEVVDKIDEMRDSHLGEFLLTITKFRIEDLDPRPLAAIFTVLQEAKARIAVLEDDLAHRSDVYATMQPPLLGADLQEAEQGQSEFEKRLTEIKAETDKEAAQNL